MSYQEAVKFFKAADKDNSGELSYGELSAVLTKMGYGSGDIEKFFLHCDTSGDNLISLDEFLSAVGAQPEQAHKEAALRRAFRAFDKDGNGEIDHKELDSVFKEMGKHFTEDELKRMIALCDHDNSGTINYEEFIKQCF